MLSTNAYKIDVSYFNLTKIIIETYKKFKHYEHFQKYQIFFNVDIEPNFLI